MLCRSWTSYSDGTASSLRPSTQGPWAARARGDPPGVLCPTGELPVIVLGGAAHLAHEVAHLLVVARPRVVAPLALLAALRVRMHATAA